MDDVGTLLGFFKIKDSFAAPQVCSADDLINLGYPTPPTRRSYLVYDIEPAAEFVNYTCNYDVLQGKPANAALGHPFATSLIEVLVTGKPP